MCLVSVVLRMEEPEEEDDDFVPLDVMPSSRLNDVVLKMEGKRSSVVNIDAILPPKEDGDLSLQTILYKMPENVKVFSLRFNNLSSSSIEVLTDWISSNSHLEMLYTSGSNIDEKCRKGLEDAWKKNLIGHRTDNFGYTFIRVTADKALVEATDD